MDKFETDKESEGVTNKRRWQAWSIKLRINKQNCSSFVSSGAYPIVVTHLILTECFMIILLIFELTKTVKPSLYGTAA